ncbi:MAG: exosortase system-associated protein, TIGR04073 family [Methylomonas sp.]|nr:exosortase system-associated protein, TIGR04073 family [Methylomonas sp.]
MKHTRHTLASIVLVVFFAAAGPVQAEPTESYGEIVGRKLLSGLGNLTTAPVEIPKNVIITSNESNVFYGFLGGTFKGIFLMAGRMGVGLADLLTAPIPTYPIVAPLYVWDDFYAETNYGPAFVFEESR